MCCSTRSNRKSTPVPPAWCGGGTTGAAHLPPVLLQLAVPLLQQAVPAGDVGPQCLHLPLRPAVLLRQCLQLWRDGPTWAEAWEAAAVGLGGQLKTGLKPPACGLFRTRNATAAPESVRHVAGSVGLVRIGLTGVRRLAAAVPNQGCLSVCRPKCTKHLLSAASSPTSEPPQWNTIALHCSQNRQEPPVATGHASCRACRSSASRCWRSSVLAASRVVSRCTSASAATASCVLHSSCGAGRHRGRTVADLVKKKT